MASFGELLRQLRNDAGLTQEELADAAQMSPRSVSDLERGINQTARRESRRLLADALQLTGPEREAFEAAARGRVVTAGAVAATKTLPRDIGSFVARETELADIALAASNGATAGVCVMGGMAGVGKTALAVHAAHLLAPQFPDGQIFLPLHAHTPGRKPADPSNALASLLRVTGVASADIPPDLETRMWAWRDHVASKKLLLVLDDAADSEQVRPLLPTAPGSMVLITSRRHLTALEDATAISLDALPSADSATLLVRLADRQDLEASDSAITEIGKLCGHLPLAIGIMARRLHHHPTWSPADLVTELESARDRLAVMYAEDLSVATAFDLSYQDLTEPQQRLFRRLGLHHGVDLDAYAAAALADVSLDAAQRGLEDLYDRYLLAESSRGRFGFHDLIRQFAQDLAAGDPPVERRAATDRLLDYYLHTARTADRYLGQRVPEVAVMPPAHVPELATRTQALSWMETERLNLHASAQDAAANGRPGHAAAIPAAMHEYLRSQGHWHEALALDLLAAEAANHAEGQLARAHALCDLADMQLLTDDYPAATASLGQALALYRTMGHRIGEANALTQLGTVELTAGEGNTASPTLAQALRLYTELGDKLGEANALTQLGTARRAVGDLAGASAHLGQALDLYQNMGDKLGEACALATIGTVQHLLGDGQAVASLNQALEIYRTLGDRIGEAGAVNCLGDVALAALDLPLARSHYDQAHAIAVRFAARKQEAHALAGLGRCSLSDGNTTPGIDLMRKALAIYQQIRSPEARQIEEDLRLATP